MSTKSPRTFTREFKLDLCRQVHSGQKRPAQLCREHQLTEGLLLRWRREFELRGEAAFSAKDQAEASPTALLGAEGGGAGTLLRPAFAGERPF